MSQLNVDSEQIIRQTKRLQEHLRNNDQMLLNIPDLAALCVATTCLPDWKSSVQNRKLYPNSFISSISDFAETQHFKAPSKAGHLLMCAQLCDAATTSAPFMKFCADLNYEPSTSSQALYFMLPFAISNRAEFHGSEWFPKWFPELDTHLGYSKFEEVSTMCNSQEYKDSINAIFRKLDFDFSAAVHPLIAEKHSLYAPRPAEKKDSIELQKELLANIAKIKAIVPRTDLLKVANYSEAMEKISSTISRGVFVKDKVLQKRVLQSAALLSSMELNPIDTGILRADLVSQYETLAPSITKKQQLVNWNKLNNNGDVWAYDFNALTSHADLDLDELEKKVEKMIQAEAILAKYL
jgi:hypothetical protein